MDLNIKGKTALVTGGDSGLGIETAKFLAREGVNVVLSDKANGKELRDAVKQVEKDAQDGAKVMGIAADISKNQEVLDLAKKIEAEFGGAHIIFHSAGARGAAGDFLELTDDDWMKTIDIDLMGAVRVARAFIPQMQKLKWGRMVLVASENAFQPYEEESPYNACKAGIINLSKCLSRAYSKENLLFNCISPAYIETPMTDAMMETLAKEKDISVEEAVEWFAKNKRPHIAMERRGKPEEVAAVVAFLCSEHASFVNGSNVRIDGGAVESAFG
ncbi:MULTISPECIES: SDR family NAD(P)-dependent oxidoreductase [Zobellia]|uniref:Short-chain dehydrogenase/reductase SDR n=1 Tax=Zobellia galactanivorans (strain DSM 12802 / CCUG 47099 / CIP 106680 / NCIMB 13871 / Dsij) TaxID=63186 RepID=G0LA97_ZOBGA|nr:MULTISPECIES: SDR family oxidoreductase [Zobellia]MBU3028354.1 SDR family oxidoreductase [Zobellia galactanivorans]OWW26218.1 ketoacyl reductase [Zobellia sp. OII3]CAZ95161.1 Short-chain dehydrogenase/reductase SDR [Zobellia galactanivorans]